MRSATISSTKGDLLHVDRNTDTLRVKLRGRQASLGEQAEKIEANLLAAELLVPARFLEIVLNDIENVDLHGDHLPPQAKSGQSRRPWSLREVK